MTPTISQRPVTLAPSQGALVFEHLRLHLFVRILFVECGDGWVAEEALRRVQRGRVMGIDRSPELIDRATAWRSNPGLLDFTTWDGVHVPAADASFDRIVSAVPLASVPDPERVLRELRRAMADRGELYLLDTGAAIDTWLARTCFSAPVELGRSMCRAAAPGQPSAAVRLWRATALPRVAPVEAALIQKIV